MSLVDTLDRHRRPIGRYAWVMAWVALVGGQLHALARFATEDGKEDLEYPGVEVWAVPAADLLAPLLEWADPYLVYVHYGKIWGPVFLGFFLCALLVRHDRRPRGWERWAWRVALVGYGWAVLAVTATYWTQWSTTENFMLGAAFVAGMPGLLLTLAGSTVLGVTLLLRGFRPWPAALLLAATFPLAFAILEVTSMGSVALPVAFAFAFLGRRIARGTAPQPVTPADEPPTRAPAQTAGSV